MRPSTVTITAGAGRIVVVLALVAATLVVGAADRAEAQTTCFGRTPTILARPGVPVNGTSGRDVILGTSGPDTIRGNGGNDLICSLGGNDSVWGGRGNDRIALGGGNDNARGGSGADRIDGGSGRDTIRGGSGDDTLNGQRGADRVLGQRGVDKCTGGRGQDRMNCELPDVSCAVTGLGAGLPSRLFLNTSGLDCAQATTLFEEYRNFPFSIENGNSLSASISGGWGCTTPTATNSAIAGYDSACFNTNGRQFYVTSGTVTPRGYGDIRIGMTRSEVEAAIGAPTSLRFEGACAFLTSSALPDVTIFYGWPDAPSTSDFAFGEVGWIRVGQNAIGDATTRGVRVLTPRDTVRDRYGPDLREILLFSPTEHVLSGDRRTALQFTYANDAVSRIVVMKRAGLEQLEWCF